MLFLSYLYKKPHIPQVVSLFVNLKVILIAIVANAFLTFTRPILKSKAEIFIAFFSFLLLLIKINPFILIVLCFIFSQFLVKVKHSISDHHINQTLNLIPPFLGLLLIILGLTILYILDKKTFQLSLIMAKINLFSFGGAYTALPLMLHELVENMMFFDSKTFIDGIALGQITPGPILITATFAGYLVCGLPCAFLATFYAFSPSFLIYLICANLTTKIRNHPVFLRGKKGILSTFSALLLFATFKICSTIDWTLVKIVLFFISFFALNRGINILYIILFGSLFSIIYFS